MRRKSRKHRRSRRNSWHRQPRLHSRAARKGWRRKSRSRRRTRRNAGTMSLVRRTTSAARRGFSLNVLKRGGTILAGNVGTTFFAEHAGRMLPMLASHPVGQIATLFGVATLQAAVVQWAKIGKYLNPADILIGGFLAGITRAARTVLPGTFQTCGLGEDLDGLSGWHASPQNISRAFQLMNGMGYAGPGAVNPGLMNGLGWAPGPGNPTIGTHGVGDYAQLYQTSAPVVITALDGMADSEVQREIAAQM